ncbi:SIR2 family protein [Geoalkalibacter halelectricus]|uniref:SIR2 family protein n=1 Tax=Geoalkalibacter halelectricus TaxID=2847045 RepID=A0ABY5ZQX3_9BACT|nr:SIR2 family protein [Geoalkalibacter halelectricus]MDO3377710.1 SIR2 family protein [Geoalkalibacter halelectricus]UWZ81498.1 SIR2 family protein [Geoalkalibacter halelectricus]
MANYHNPVQHLKYLRQSLSQNTEAIGFFMSAGCPLSVSMPEGEWPLIPDVENLTIYINEQLKDNEKYAVLSTELSKAGKNNKNIEDVLSFLRSLLSVSKGGDVRGLSEKDLEGLESCICKEIVEKLDVNLPGQETPYHRLCKWVRSIDRKVAIEIFTTNYDLLMEQALEDLEIPYFDGFVGSRRSFFDLRAVGDNLIPVHWSRLWKIHGSINWYQEEDKHQKKVFRSSEIKKDASHLIYPSHLKYEESRKMPYLALIDQLNQFIRRKSSFLILSGYSFNDGHLNDTIVNALKANPTAMVLGLMYDRYEKKSETGGTIERYPKAYRLAENQHNLNIWTFDKAIIGTNLGRWQRTQNSDSDDPDLLRFVDMQKDEKTDASEDLIKLGDFSVFTNFLKKIIGPGKEETNV